MKQAQLKRETSMISVLSRDDHSQLSIKLPKKEYRILDLQDGNFHLGSYRSVVVFLNEGDLLVVLGGQRSTIFWLFYMVADIPKVELDNVYQFSSACCPYEGVTVT